MREDILGLYETFLGKIKFFQQFIKLLLKMNDELETLKRQLEDELKITVALQTSMDECKAEIADLETKLDNIKPKKPTAPQNFSRTASDIMQSQWEQYQNENYPLENND